MAEKLEQNITSNNVEGRFSVKGTKYTVSMTDTELSWKNSSKHGDETVVPLMDIISVKTAASKTSKTGSIDSWILCYAQRKKKNHLRKTSVVFFGEQDNCQEWTKNIQRVLDKFEQRPKSILVLVNPVSGWSKGEKQYRSKVAPLFEEASIHTDVKVTQRAGHSTEILDTYDMTSIDSVVLVGGDGMYHEVVNGMMKRKVKEVNADLNDPSLELPMLDIPVGVIPCGTGNGIAEANMGCIDVETAALTIIIGKKNYGNIDTVYSAGEFIIFSILLVGCGLWGELIHKTEQRRNLGVFRYPVIMFNALLLHTPRPVTLNIQYRKKSSNKTESENTSKNDETSGDKKEQGEEIQGAVGGISGGEEWVTLEKEYIGPITFSANVFGDADDNAESLIATTSGFAMKPCTRMQMLKFLGSMIQKDLGTRYDFIDYFKTSEYKVKVVKPSSPESENGFLERILDIDGEAVEIKHPEYSVKHFPKRLMIFANVPEDYYLRMLKNQK